MQILQKNKGNKRKQRFSTLYFNKKSAKLNNYNPIISGYNCFNLNITSIYSDTCLQYYPNQDKVPLKSKRAQ